MVFNRRNQASYAVYILFLNLFNSKIDILTGRKIATLHQIVDHALQTHFATIVGSVNASNTIIHQFLDFFRQNYPSSTTINSDVSVATFEKQIVHIFKKFNVAALVTGDGNALSIFLYGAIHNFLYRAVVTQMNHFGTGRLNNSTHDIDGRIMTVE